jgi:hypothetical protein
LEKNVLDAAAMCKLLCGGRLQGIRIFRGIAASSTTFAGPGRFLLPALPTLLPALPALPVCPSLPLPTLPALPFL